MVAGSDANFQHSSVSIMASKMQIDVAHLMLVPPLTLRLYTTFICPDDVSESGVRGGGRRRVSRGGGGGGGISILPIRVPLTLCLYSTFIGPDEVGESRVKSKGCSFR